VSLAAAGIALAGAALMVVSLFLDWYAVKEGATGDNATIKLHGWNVFEATDAMMVLAALATLALVVLRPRGVALALLAVGALMAGWIAVQLVDRPAVLGFFDRSDLSLQVGAWLGLLGALLVLAAGAALRIGSTRIARSPTRP
jgi:hypothetical protein